MSTQEPSLEQKKPEYESPAIIYEGTITTRAGTPLGEEPNDSFDLDADDLFSSP